MKEHGAVIQASSPSQGDRPSHTPAHAEKYCVRCSALGGISWCSVPNTHGVNPSMQIDPDTPSFVQVLRKNLIVPRVILLAWKEGKGQTAFEERMHTLGLGAAWKRNSCMEVY